jgi:ATP-binding cassette subfamily C protein
VINSSTKDMVVYFFRAYPRRSALLVFLLMLSGLAEGVGFFSLLPMLEVAASQHETPGGDPSDLTRILSDVLGQVGLEPTLGVMLAIVCTAMILKAGFLWLAMREVGYTVAHIATDLRLRLIRSLMHASWSHFVSQPAGEYSAAISQEAHRASAAFRNSCSALGGVIRILAYLVVAVLVSWEVALAALLVAGGVVWVLRGFVVMAREAGQEQTTVMRSLISRLTQALPGIKPVKAMARERFLLPMLERETHGFNQAQQKQVLASESMRAFQEPILIIVLAAGLWGTLTFGDTRFSSVLVLALLFYRLVGTVNKLQGQYQTMSQGESAFESIRDHIERAESNREVTRGQLPAPALDDEIRFDHVSFSYPGTQVLDDVSFSVPVGSFTAFIGPSGSGKTTILDLMVGLQVPDDGTVAVDGVSLSEISMADWRAGIGYVPQDMVLFHSSIFENVTLSNDDFTRDDVRRALEDAGAWDFVSRHPEGMDRLVGEAGAKLSGGQRQRIAIARALVGSPRLLILDEATTALDPETEAEICETLENLGRRVTIVAVSHQPALRDVADQVYEVDRGTVTLVRDSRAATRVAGGSATGD